MKRLFLLITVALAAFGANAATLLASEILLTPDNKIVQFATSGADGMQNQATSRKQVSFNVYSNNYYQCADGHWGLMSRASLEQIPSTLYRGVGFVAGDLAGAPEMPAPGYLGNPFAVIETWGSGVMPAGYRFLFPKSVSPKLYDGILYKFTFDSTHTINNFARLRIHAYNWPKAQYELVFETGDVLDNNWAVDMGRESIVFFNTAGAGRCGYSLQISNVWVSWSAAGPELPDLTSLPWTRP